MTMKTSANEMNGRKLKIHFVEETRFVVPTWATIRSWNQLLAGTRLALLELALVEALKPVRRQPV